MARAVAYLRSTKDRADVSLSAQLRAIEELAQRLQLQIVETYDDPVRKGSTDDRPALNRLVSAIKRRDRGWDTLLVYDTSRIARGRYFAQAFKHRCRKFGVAIRYVRLPETDPVSQVILESVLEAMDEVHSLLSRDRAIAGQRENVRRGFRAGGAAPWGYELAHQATGVIREGSPVLKSKLVPGPEAPLAQTYLQERAAGRPRAALIAELGLELSASTLINVEWNALTYAGHTVWNRHAAKSLRGAGQGRRRPRGEWQVQENTHPALISTAQAEALLTRLECSNIGAAVSAARRARSDYVLAEVLWAPDGRRWVGAGDSYRLKPADGRRGVYVPRRAVETAVLERVRAELLSAAFLERMLEAVHAMQVEKDPAAPARRDLERLERQKARAAHLALEYDGRGGDEFSRLIPDLTRRIEQVQREVRALEAERDATEAVKRMTLEDLRDRAAESLESDAAVAQWLQRVELDPETMAARVTYRLSVASPGRSEGWAGSVVQLEPRQRRRA